MSKWDLVLLAMGAAGIALLVFGSKQGLPLPTSPAFQRGLTGAAAGITGIYLLEVVVPKNSNWFDFLTVVVYGGIPLWVMLGGRKADAEWRLLNEAETEKKQQEAERQRDLLQKQQQLAEENTTYAPLGEPTSSPTDLTDTAKRIADELKKR